MLNVNNVGSLGLKWQFGNIVGLFLSSPAVADGVACVGLGDGYLYAPQTFRRPASRFGRRAAGGSGSSPAGGKLEWSYVGSVKRQRTR